MKGTKEVPMCGFSNSVVQILNHYGVNYKDVNVLENPDIISRTVLERGLDSGTAYDILSIDIAGIGRKSQLYL